MAKLKKDIIYDPPILSVMLETINVCSRKCDHCPQSTHPLKPHIMYEELFKKIVDELAEMNYKKRISLYENCEPLLDKRLVRFTKYVSGKCPDCCMAINTNGDLLTYGLLISLFEAGQDEVKILQYDDEISPHIKEIYNKLTEEEKAKVTIRHVPPHLAKKVFNSNRGGTVNYGKSKGFPFRKMCFKPFTQLYITSNGEVVQCASDFVKKAVVGDLNKQLIKEVWLSEKMTKLREDLFKKNRKDNIVCSKCNLSGSINDSRHNEIKELEELGFDKAKGSFFERLLIRMRN